MSLLYKGGNAVHFSVQQKMFKISALLFLIGKSQGKQKNDNILGCFSQHLRNPFNEKRAVKPASLGLPNWIMGMRKRNYETRDEYDYDDYDKMHHFK